LAIHWIAGATAESLALPPGPADAAALRARHLDALFVHLRAATFEEEGDAMVAAIWKLWLQAGRPEIDASMQQALDFMGQGLPALAMPILDDIVARAPDWAEGWNERATVLYLMGEHDG